MPLHPSARIQLYKTGWCSAGGTAPSLAPAHSRGGWKLALTPQQWQLPHFLPMQQQLGKPWLRPALRLSQQLCRVLSIGQAQPWAFRCWGGWPRPQPQPHSPTLTSPAAWGLCSGWPAGIWRWPARIQPGRWTSPTPWRGPGAVGETAGEGSQYVAAAWSPCSVGRRHRAGPWNPCIPHCFLSWVPFPLPLCVGRQLCRVSPGRGCSWLPSLVVWGLDTPWAGRRGHSRLVVLSVL